MRILLDESLPSELKLEFLGHDVRMVQDAGTCEEGAGAGGEARVEEMCRDAWRRQKDNPDGYRIPAERPVL